MKVAIVLLLNSYDTQSSNNNDIRYERLNPLYCKTTAGRVIEPTLAFSNRELPSAERQNCFLVGGKLIVDSWARYVWSSD